MFLSPKTRNVFLQCTQMFLTKMVWCTQIFLQWWCGARRFFLQRWCGPHKKFFSSRLFAAIGSTQIFLPIGGVHANYSTRLFRHPTHMVPSCKSMWPSNMLQALVPNGSGAEHIAFYKTHVGSLTKKWIKKSPTTNNIKQHCSTQTPLQNPYHMLFTKHQVTSHWCLHKQTTFSDL